MAKTFSLTEISDYLEQQQEIVYMLDKYSIPTLLDSDKIPNINDFSNYLADSVMYHIFTNIRNIYQDSIFISQGLIEAKPYYISTSLFYALREADEFLTDIAYIVNDKKNKVMNIFATYSSSFVKK